MWVHTRQESIYISAKMACGSSNWLTVLWFAGVIVSPYTYVPILSCLLFPATWPCQCQDRPIASLPCHKNDLDRFSWEAQKTEPQLLTPSVIPSHQATSAANAQTDRQKKKKNPSIHLHFYVRGWRFCYYLSRRQRCDGGDSVVFVLASYLCRAWTTVAEKVIDGLRASGSCVKDSREAGA